MRPSAGSLLPPPAYAETGLGAGSSTVLFWALAAGNLTTERSGGAAAATLTLAGLAATWVVAGPSA